MRAQVRRISSDPPAEFAWPGRPQHSPGAFLTVRSDAEAGDERLEPRGGPGELLRGRGELLRRGARLLGGGRDLLARRGGLLGEARDLGGRLDDLADFA